jgi:isocitrate dehydrogenase kinase/phosphatase
MTVDPLTVADILDTGFATYHRRRTSITRRATARFEAKDWSAMRRDALERRDAYGRSIDEVIADLASASFTTAHRGTWTTAMGLFRGRYLSDPFRPIAETFFNSVARKRFGTAGTDVLLEFLDWPDEPPEVPDRPTTRVYAGDASFGWIRDALRDCRFHMSWEDAHGDVLKASGRLPFTPERVEVVDHLFYRGKAAYLVGSIAAGDESVPFSFAIRHGRSGLRIAAVLVGEEDVSILFSYTRAAFLVATDAPCALVSFLSGLMPHRPSAEIYAAIGFRKQAKTERYRDLMRYMERSDDRFVEAQGIKGLVMIVFTLPGYEVVFKVVRDRFPPQKSVTPRQVAEKYQFVARHDRAGRLVEAQRFERLSLPLSRFDPELLAELTSDAARTVTVEGDELMFSAVYVERRVTPLDMFIRAAAPQEAARGIIDYGATIKNLAASNIFPGDMLLKNFGVTSRGRVVFYDYDELSELTDCHFRAFPQSTDATDEMSVTPAYGVGPNDVFPEELPRFLGLTPELRAVFEKRHADLFAPDFWVKVQRRIESGEIIEILPYRRSRALAEET